MSYIVDQFDPSTAGTTQFAAPNSSANGALVFWNESNISINLTFANGTTMYLPAWYHRHVCGATGDVNIAWAMNTQLNSSLPPMSAVVIESYASGEKFPLDGPLVRQTNGETAVANAIAVTNQGFAAGTIFISGTPVFDTAGNAGITITNDGKEVLGDNQNDGLLTVTGKDIQKTTASSDGFLAYDTTGHALAQMTIGGFTILDTAGNVRAVLGTGGKLSLNNAAGALVSAFDATNGWLGNGHGTLHFGQVVKGDTFECDPNGDTYLKSASSSNQSVNIQPDGATTVFAIKMDRFIAQNGARWDYETAGVQVNGGTSGTATIYQDCIGLVKRVLIILNNFRTGAGAQTIGLPVAFTTAMRIKTGGIGTSVTNGGIAAISGGIAQTINVTTTLASLGGSATAVTNIYSFSEGEVFHAVDSIQFQAAGTAAHSAIVELYGQ